MDSPNRRIAESTVRVGNVNSSTIILLCAVRQVEMLIVCECVSGHGLDGEGPDDLTFATVLHSEYYTVVTAVLVNSSTVLLIDST